MKPKREITLGEMHDECKKRGRCRAIDKVVDKCPYASICIDTMAHCEEACDGSEYDVFTNPCDWNLTDPPRFTEAQMAFWKALYSVGVSKVFKAPSELKFSTKSTTLPTAGNMGSLCCEAWNWLGSEELLDLAELFGKEEVAQFNPFAELRKSLGEDSIRYVTNDDLHNMMEHTYFISAVEYASLTPEIMKTGEVGIFQRKIILVRKEEEK